MEKNQYELCVEVLRVFEKAGLLDDIILIGSWCQLFYKGYFGETPYSPVIKTRDVDFLIPDHLKIKTKKDIPALLKPLGFILSFTGTKGYIRLEHPGLIVEFLTPERGKGTNTPVPLQELGINLVALRFLNILTDNIIKLKIDGFEISLPHPANYALHKLIISQRRQGSKNWKSQKDIDTSVEILRVLDSKGETETVKKVFDSLPQKWQKKILSALEEIDEKNLLIAAFEK